MWHVFLIEFVEFHFTTILADHLLAGSLGFAEVPRTQVGALFKSRDALLKACKFSCRLLVTGFRQMLGDSLTSITPFTGGRFHSRQNSESWVSRFLIGSKNQI